MEKIKKNMLFEVLREEQEPFVLKDFIAERRRRTTTTNQLHFPSLSSPSGLTTTVLVREAAARIHAHYDQEKKKNKPKGATFSGLLFVLKQLVAKKRQRPKEICGDDGVTVNLDSPLPVNGMVLLRTSPAISPDAHHQDSSPSPTSPSASPGRRRPERQLLCGARDVTMEEESRQNTVPDHKDQFSPVSVLDPPFQEQEEDQDQTHCFEQSLAIVLRSRRQLLSKLRRFERLAAGLDPLDLDKTMAYSSDEDDDNLEEEWMMMGGSVLNENKKMQEEEEKKRLDEVEAKSIDMMAEMEMARSSEEWKTQQVLEVGGFLERHIFLFLTEELSNDLLN